MQVLLMLNAIKRHFYGYFALGGAPIPSSSAGLPAGSPRTGRSAETAGGHIISICHPVRSRLSHPTAGRCGAGAYQTAHHSAGREKGFMTNCPEFKLLILYSVTFLFNTRPEFKTMNSLMISWIHWDAGLLKLRRL